MQRMRRRLRTWLVGGMILSGLAGSAAWAGWPFGRRTIPVDQFVTGPIKMTIYDHFKAVEKRTFAADSTEVEAVKDWLGTHSKGWSLDISSYAPGQRRFSGERFDLNIGERHVILNYRTDSSSRGMIQVSREIEPGGVRDVFGLPRAR